MKHALATLMLLSGFFVEAPAKAEPMAPCAAMLKAYEQTINARQLDGLMALFTGDVQFFSALSNELIIGSDALRAHNAKLSPDLKIQAGDHAATQVSTDVVTCSGYLVATGTKASTVLRISLVLVNVNGSWLIAQQHTSAMPRPNQN